MVIEPDPSVLDAFWRDASADLGLKQTVRADHFHFGDTAELASDLVDEMLNGTKRATAGLIAEMEADDDKLPEAGDHWIVVDGGGEPRLV
ncbi:MAG: ASCH domain-containing protein, partial [Geminicoccaceae bacterium]